MVYGVKIANIRVFFIFLMRNWHIYGQNPNIQSHTIYINDLEKEKKVISI